MMRLVFYTLLVSTSAMAPVDGRTPFDWEIIAARIRRAQLAMAA